MEKTKRTNTPLVVGDNYRVISDFPHLIFTLNKIEGISTEMINKRTGKVIQADAIDLAQIK